MTLKYSFSWTCRFIDSLSVINICFLLHMQTRFVFLEYVIHCFILVEFLHYFKNNFNVISSVVSCQITFNLFLLNSNILDMFFAISNCLFRKINKRFVCKCMFLGVCFNQKKVVTWHFLCKVDHHLSVFALWCRAGWYNGWFTEGQTVWNGY